MAQLPLQRGGSLPSPEVRIYTPATSVPTPGLAATGPPVFVSPTLTSSSGRSTPRQAFMPTQMLVPGAAVKVTAPTESKDAAPAPVQPAPAQAAVAPVAVSAGPTPPPPQLPVPSSRDRSKSPRKARSRISVSQLLGGGLPQRIQGISCCTLCHALLQIFAGKVRIQTFQSSSDLPAPPAHLVDRALNYELSEGEDVDASDSFCRLHLLHKNRYELWLKGQDAIRRCSARGDAQATLVIRGCAEEMGKLDSVAGKVEQEYLEAFGAFFKQLQQDVRENLFKTLMGKADELVSAWQEEIKEVNQQIDKKVQQKRTQLRAAVHRRHENAKEDFWRQHEKHCAQQFVSCLVDNCRNMHIGRANYASTAFKELEISQQARRPITEKSVEGRAQSRADQERARRQREMNIWLGKMDQLQTLQHLQACKDRELVYLRVAMTIRRLEEDQGVEHRLVLNRVSQHLQQMRLFLEKTLRASGVSSCLDLMGVTPGSIVLEQESFIHMVLRNERILGDVTAIASPRGASSLNRSQCQGISASFGSGSRGGKGADQMGASLELRAFGEFLGARFPSLRAALSALDITGTGRVACFELESWLRQQMYPGNARMLLKDLGRKGSLGMAQLRFLAPAFVRQSDPRGRPGGATAAALVRSLWQSVDSKARQYQPLEAQQAAIRCCRCGTMDRKMTETNDSVCKSQADSAAHLLTNLRIDLGKLAEQGNSMVDATEKSAAVQEERMADVRRQNMMIMDMLTNAQETMHTSAESLQSFTRSEIMRDSAANMEMQLREVILKQMGKMQEALLGGEEDEAGQKGMNLKSAVSAMVERLEDSAQRLEMATTGSGQGGSSAEMEDLIRRELGAVALALSQQQRDTAQESMMQVGETVHGELSNFKASEPAHWRQDAQVGQVSEVVNNKLSEFSEQINENMHRIENGVDKVLQSVEKAPGGGGDKESRKSRGADRG